VWLNGVPVDWSWLKANDYTTSTEPNNPTSQSAVMLYDYGAEDLKLRFTNFNAIQTYNYICEFA
jgi:hypothetical protein